MFTFTILFLEWVHFNERHNKSCFKGPCSPKWLCALELLFETPFCQMQCFDWLTHLWGVHFFHAWPKHASTHTEDSNFQLPEIIFLDYRVRNAFRVNMGL